MVSRMHARGVRNDERCSNAIAHRGSSARRGTGSSLAHAMVNVVPCVATRSTRGAWTDAALHGSSCSHAAIAFQNGSDDHPS